MEFEFAIYDNKPVFEDEYLYDTTSKKAIKLHTDNTEWYLIDWNENGSYNDIGVDYFGVKMPFKSKPFIALLKDTNLFNHNGKSFTIDQSSKFQTATPLNKFSHTPMSYITDFIPIDLADGTTLDSNILKDHQQTVIYFWATWCAPCVETLEKMEPLKEELSKTNINFIPVYYKCTEQSVLQLNQNKQLSFTPRAVTEESANAYQVRALAQTYVFDQKGKLISETFQWK
jgi:thiol-disulfide isomerase/thioredoxin